MAHRGGERKPQKKTRISLKCRLRMHEKSKGGCTDPWCNCGCHKNRIRPAV